MKKFMYLKCFVYYEMYIGLYLVWIECLINIKKNGNIFIKLLFILSYLFVFCMNKSFFLKYFI